MTWSIPPLLLLLACTPAPPASPSPTGAAQLAELEASLAAWRADPGPEAEARLLAAAEPALLVPEPSAELDVVLGDTLANALARPELGLPRLEPHRDLPEARDVWLDALLRADDPRLGPELARLADVHVDLDHPTAVALQAQSARHLEVGWAELRDAMAGAHLVESAHARAELDRPVEALAPLLGVLPDLLPGWEIAVAVARAHRMDDPDPLLTAGVVPVGDQRLLGYAHTPDALTAAAAELDVRQPPQPCLVAVEAVDPHGATASLAVQGRYQDGALWLFGASEPNRAVAWVEAAEARTRDPQADLSGYSVTAFPR